VRNETGVVANTTSDSFGSFSLSVPATTYDVVFSKSGYTPVTKLVSVSDGGRITLYPELEDATTNGSEATARFNVTIDSTNAPVNETDALNVTATVSNTGGESGTQTVTLSINGTAEDSASVQLDSGESTVIFLDWTTTIGDAGSYTASVATANETTTTSITVEEPVLSIGRAVAGSDRQISLQEIQTAINLWAEDDPVPDTGGQVISLQKIQELINAWAEDRTVSTAT
jgi:hypothetical protein